MAAAETLVCGSRKEIEWQRNRLDGTRVALGAAQHDRAVGFGAGDLDRDELVVGPALGEPFADRCWLDICLEQARVLGQFGHDRAEGSTHTRRHQFLLADRLDDRAIQLLVERQLGLARHGRDLREALTNGVVLDLGVLRQVHLLFA